MALISATGLAWRLPDGRALFSGLDFHIGPGPARMALVGVNGIGKSTLLKIIAGMLPPSEGALAVTGTLAYLPQDLSAARAGSVAAALGLEGSWEAWKRVRAGVCLEPDLDTLADTWDLEDRMARCLQEAGFADWDPDRPCSELSGGEMLRLALAGMRLREPDILLLDEPTNHLDMAAREEFLGMAAGWKKILLTASHDRALLRLMDGILEMSNAGMSTYGGGYDFYAERKKAEDAAALAEVQDREAGLRKDREERRRSLERQEKRSRRAAKGAEEANMPKILLGARKRRAENTSARLRDVHADRVAGSLADLEAAREKIREDSRIRVDLGSDPLPARKLLLRAVGVNHRFPDGSRLWAEPLSFEMRGRARLSLAGPNGSGKSLLVAMIRGRRTPTEGRLELGTERIALLDQQVGILDPSLSVLENIRALARPGLAEHELRNRLGRFRFRGDAALKPAGILSGGEKMRAGLACLLAGDNAPQLLILDEPTNNLDFAGREAVESALEDFAGGLLVVSHDREFLAALEMEAEIALSRPA